MTTQLGFQLRDAALVQSREGREDAIQQVREWLWERRSTLTEFTGDDVHDALEALGYAEGDTRWSGSVVKGWAAIRPTEQFVPSRRACRHGAPLRRWVWFNTPLDAGTGNRYR